MAGKREMSMKPSQKTAYRRASKREWKMRLRIRAAHDAGKKKRAAYLTSRYLNSYDAKYAATVNANRTLKPHRRVPLEKLPEIAAKLDPWRGSAEEVIVHFKPKRSNEHEFRPIMDFGIENRGLQILVRRVLQAQADIHPHQFSAHGGRPAAGKTIVEALDEGYVWAAEIDIINCFSSFDGERVAGLLPVPEEVTQKVITARHLNIKPGNINNWIGPANESVDNEETSGPLADALAEARRGLPQGSAVSHLVVDLLLATTISNLSGNGKVVGYVDNFLVMAKEKNDAVSMTNALRDALKEHPAGPLWPKSVGLAFARDGFDFLGYTFRRKNGNVSVTPSARNLSKFEHEFSRGFNWVADPSLSMKKKQGQLTHLRKYVRSWTSAFSIWSDAATLRDKKMALINDTANGHCGPQST